MTNWAQAERAAMCDLFEQVGPDAPTLCGDWRTRDLAAHLVARERRPDTAPGIIISFGPVTAWTEKVRRRIAERPWDQLVSAVRSGPPIWSPARFGPVDEMVNTVEFFVHHEDVRRAAESWEPRDLDPAHEDQLWKAVRRMKFLVRSSPVGLVLTRPDGERIVAKQGEREVAVSGPASELLLFCFGRQQYAEVGFVGDDADIAAVRRASFGL